MDSEEILRSKINLETAQVPWRELQTFYARGQVICIDAQLDLVEVAFQVSSDNKSVIESWRQEQKLAPVSDAQAMQLFDDDALVWTVVVKPWVLVQASADDA